MNHRKETTSAGFIVCIATVVALAVPTAGLALDAAVLDACRQYLRADSAPPAEVLSTITAFEGDIHPILAALSASPATERSDVSGVLARQSFRHPELKQRRAEDQLHFYVP
ncbi:MAG: hypothetical protein KDB14_10000, partial [Planctomycetales bacterium]|nr:hypothetical protein [Planctomycetales bacterium]